MSHLFKISLLLTALIILIQCGNCPNDCSGHGDCVRRTNNVYYCNCNTNYEGSDCSIFRQVLVVNQVRNGTLRFMEWRFFNFSMNPGNGFRLFLYQRQSDYDIDIYVQKGKFPTFGDYFIKDTTASPNISIEFDDPIEVTTIFYVGLYGYRGNTDYFIWYNNTGGCPAGCSSHGTCTRGSCICDAGYAGLDCNSRVDPIVLNYDYRNIGVQEGKWKYYYIELQQTGNLRLNVSQTRGDVDIYIRYGAIPTRMEWNYADITTNTTVNMDILEPSLGLWYFGFYGYDTSTFSFRLSSNSQCPDRCSKHGNCVGSYCDCYLEYRGPSCETKRDPLLDNQVVTGYVSQDAWNYYRYSSNTANNYIIQLNHSSNVDCDIYVNVERNPTLTDYVYRDISPESVINMRIDNPGTTIWYIGINGYTTCDYRLKVFSSNQCIGGCGQHGRCSTSGRCICDQGWTGMYCEERTNTLRNGVPVLNQTIMEGDWHYYQFTLVNATSQLNAVIKEYDSEGFVWLFVAAGGNPSLISYDEADTETNTAIHRIKIEFETPRINTQFFIGVYGSPFALRNTNYDIVVWTPPF